MRTLFVALCVFLVVAALGATAVPGAETGLDGSNSTSTPTGAAPSTSTTTADSQATNRAQNASLGSEISSFMSSTAASTENSVDRGMWQASVNRSPSNAAVAQRVSTLAVRYERLRTELEQLRKARANGSISGIEYRVRRATLRAELRSLGVSVASLEPMAARSGTADERLAELRDRVPAPRHGADSQPKIGSLPPLDPSNGAPGAGRSD